MGKKDLFDWLEDISLPQPSSSDLRGKQSVRATFKLTRRAIHAISIVSAHLGIKQKSLFDHLVEDTRALNLIAREMRSFSYDEYDEPDRIQKTYVLSRKTLSSLDSTSKNFDAPRDALVEYSIQRLLPVIIKEKEKHKKRKELSSEIMRFFRSGENLLVKARNDLGEDDPVYIHLEDAMSGLYHAHKNIESFIEKGKIIEEF